MDVKRALTWEKARLGKNVVRKAYSKITFAIKAVENAWKGVSRYTGVLVSSATWDGRAELWSRVMISIRRPRMSGDGACWTFEAGTYQYLNHIITHSQDYILL